MSTTIYIHVGMHKTGTSSIQATLFKNRRRLLSYGVNYLSISQNHSTTVYPLLLDKPHLYPMNVRAGIRTEGQAARRNAVVEAALTRELKRNICSRFVISGEDLLALKPEALAQLKQKLAPFAADLRVIVYVREPYSYINSAFQQRLRGGATWEELLAQPPMPRYRRIQKFIDAFGRDHVDIRIFDRSRFVNSDLIADFLAAIRLDPELAKSLEIATVNPSLSHEAALILAAVNETFPKLENDRPNPRRFADIDELLRPIAGQPFHCPHSVFMTAQPKIVKDLAWLHATMGESVFSADLPLTTDLPQAWNDETLTSLAALINQQANSNRLSWARVRRDGRAALEGAGGFLRRWRVELGTRKPPS